MEKHQLLPQNGNPVVELQSFFYSLLYSCTTVSVLAVEVTNVPGLGKVLQGDCSIEGNLRWSVDVSDIELGISMTCHQRSLFTHGLMS